MQAQVLLDFLNLDTYAPKFFGIWVLGRARA